ncbi:MAG TPA: ABC transporter substrate-binding protein [Xanthobacteraceae bacterium]|nr:ABC transporter substrate-binding protein [Xanthobacteraceae bacterium]
MRTRLLTAAAILALTAGAAQAQDKIKIGVLATLEGALTTLGEDAIRGMEIAMKQAGAKAGGKTIEVITFPTNASPDSAIRGARKLVEQDKVDILIGPVSGSEGIAIRDYSKTQPQVTVLNGSSGALETTYVTPSPNFYRFNLDGSQWLSGLGTYIYNEKKWRKIATVAEDYSFPYTQLFGFVPEYCSLGGQITERFWVPLGTKDFASVIAKLPDDVDAIYLGLGGGDAVNFFNQYAQAGGKAKLIGGSILVDQTVLSSKGAAKRIAVGIPSAGPQADVWDNPKWNAWVKLYQDSFPADKRFTSPSLTGTAYYNDFNAVFQVLNDIKGDLSDGHKKFREGLAKIELDAPNGKIKLDQNRQAIGTNFITEVVELPNGDLVNKAMKLIPDVKQTLGFTPEQFAKLGLPSRTNPECKKSYN